MIQQTIYWCRPEEIVLTQYSFYDILVDVDKQWGVEDEGEILRLPNAQYVKEGVFADCCEEIPLNNVLAISVIRYPTMQELRGGKK